MLTLLGRMSLLPLSFLLFVVGTAAASAVATAAAVLLLPGATARTLARAASPTRITTPIPTAAVLAPSLPGLLLLHPQGGPSQRRVRLGCPRPRVEVIALTRLGGSICFSCCAARAQHTRIQW